jgi:hypothetical protein
MRASSRASIHPVGERNRDSRRRLFLDGMYVADVTDQPLFRHVAAPGLNELCHPGYRAWKATRTGRPARADLVACRAGGSGARRPSGWLPGHPPGRPPGRIRAGGGKSSADISSIELPIRYSLAVRVRLCLILAITIAIDGDSPSVVGRCEKTTVVKCWGVIRCLKSLRVRGSCARWPLQFWVLLR